MLQIPSKIFQKTVHFLQQRWRIIMVSLSAIFVVFFAGAWAYLSVSTYQSDQSFLQLVQNNPDVTITQFDGYARVEFTY